MNERHKIKGKINLRELNDVISVLRRYGLHTICEEARCPNISECMSKKRATFLIMGDGCTRGCRFCSVRHYSPDEIRLDEGRRISEAVRLLGIKYVVITSVTRDDLPLGGARVFEEVVRLLKADFKDLKIELLIPDFMGDEKAYEVIAGLDIDILNHNMETVRSLYPRIRPEADYDRSLRLLQYFSDRGLFTKSGIMVGLGESMDELKSLFNDLYRVGVKMLTIGQYLRPDVNSVEVVRYYTDEEFVELRDLALASGIEYVFSGRYVRSSYSAQEQYQEALL